MVTGGVLLLAAGVDALSRRRAAAVRPGVARSPMTVLARGSRGARSEDVRRGNLSTLLRYVHVHGPTPRSR